MQKKKADLIPETFDSYEEAAEFWDAHDTTDYWEDFETVEVHAELRGRHFEIEIAEDVLSLSRSDEGGLGQTVEEN